MGRVETRLYKQRCRRTRRLKLIVTILLMAAGVLIWRFLPPGFISEQITAPNVTPITSEFDQTVQTREVTLSEVTWYAIQTGVFSTQEAATQKASAYTNRGAPGTVVQDENKWRVFIACYETETDAATVRTRLESNQRVDTYLYPWQCPEVLMRLTGKAGQLDTVEAGFAMLISYCTALRDLAIELDAAQYTSAEVLAEVSSLADGMRLWKETVKQRFGRNIPEMVQQMMTLAESWNTREQEISDAKTTTELSAVLKMQAMSMYEDIIRWRNDLLAQ